MNKKLLYIFLLLAIIVSSCKDDEDAAVETSSINHNYLPLNVGQESIFRIDSIAYDEFTGGVDTFIYFLRERVEEKLINQDGTYSYRVSLSKRDNDTSNWSNTIMIRKNRNERNYILTENNLETINLIFPINENGNWDSNAKNVLAEQKYSYLNAHLPYTLEALSFDSSVHVSQIDNENLIEKYLAYEIYAANVGLILQKDLSLRTALDGTIVSGYDFSKTLLSY